MQRYATCDPYTKYNIEIGLTKYSFHDYLADGKLTYLRNPPKGIGKIDLEEAGCKTETRERIKMYILEHPTKRTDAGVYSRAVPVFRKWQAHTGE